ncbi:MAG: LysM peptidoglycan-binding domain-containing protein [Ilumatobacteraceae bacterium]|nr:LysM peptidoglycan-binding domain-containing protein [Ilumatobacteraceae bacterium]
MSRIHRALLAAALSAITLSTLTLPATTSAAGGSAATPGVYVVKNGDFLAGIAAKVGIALTDLLALNDLTKTSLIVPGDKLLVPAGATTAAPISARATPAAGALVHTVKSGDFLMGIATMYKVTLADLLAVNKMTIKSVINPGSQLALPADAVAPPTAPAVAAKAASGLTYTVKFGDFLAGIAAKYKVQLPDLLAVNKLKANSLILPGATLAMPAGAVAPASTSTPVVQSSAGPAGVVVAYAYAQLGKPYRFFTAGPATFDCSGLVKTAFAQIGIQMVHHAASQASYGRAVDIWSEPIKAGDLVFMKTHGGPEITHVGIAVDATHWIHAPKTGDVVRLAPIPPKGILTSVRRVIP